MPNYTYRDALAVVEKALSHVKSGSDAETALIKAATADSIPPELFRRAVHAYNTAKTVHYFEKAANKRGEKFITLDADALHDRYVGQIPHTKSASVPAKVELNYGTHPSLVRPQVKAASAPVAKQPDVEPDYTALNEQLAKTASRHVRLFNLELDSCRSELRQLACRHGAQALTKTAGVLLHSKCIDADTIDFVTAELGKERDARIKVASISPVHGLVHPDHAPVEEFLSKVAELIDLRRISRETVKMAAAGTATGTAAGTSAGTKGGTKGGGKPEKEPAIPADHISKYNTSDAGTPRQHPAVERSMEGKALEILGGANAVAGAGAKVIGDSAIAAKDVSKDWVERAIAGDNRQGDVDKAVHATKVQTNLESLLLTDPVLRNMDPDEVLSKAETLNATNPTVGADKELLRYALRDAMQYNAVPTSTARDLASMRASTAKAKLDEKSRTGK